MNKAQTIKNGFLKLMGWPRKKGAVLLFVVLFISAMLSISSGIFSVAMGQLLISGRAEDSFIALYSTDHGLERTLYRDFVSGTFTCSPTCTEDSKVVYPSGITSGGCYTMSTTKGGSPDITRIKIVGQYRCVIIPGRVVKRAFEYTYLTPLPPGPSLPASPVGEWKFEEGAGLTANDTSGNGNNGTLVNGPAWQTVASCKIGGCLSFDGTNDYVDAGSSGLYNFTTGPFTVSAWFYANAFSSTMIVSNNNASLNGWGFIVLSTGLLRLSTRGTTDETTDGTIPLQTGQWYHLAAAYSGTNGTRTLYINGLPEATETFTGSITPATLNLNIGRRPDGATYMNGRLDNVRIYDRALTPAEVLQLFNE